MRSSILYYYLYTYISLSFLKRAKNLVVFPSKHIGAYKCPLNKRSMGYNILDQANGIITYDMQSGNILQSR